ncbi:DUF305 domain-containing protein [Candidatus Woesebacteria bacterium]|nr:DUF305 domain-containing protein [Candidatus Woesebacteria bacterium]
MLQRNQFIILCTCALLCSACSTPSSSPQNSIITPTATVSAVPSPMVTAVTVESEQQFLELMILHHQEAVDQSLVISKRTTSPKLLQFSKNVAESQKREIVTMQSWLDRWYENTSSPSATYVPMMDDMTALSTLQAEQTYIAGMLHHHREAIAMAKQVKLKHPRAEVIKLADEILLIQGKEVELLSNWLQEYNPGSAQEEHELGSH